MAKISFEDALSQLEDIVNQIENDEVLLDEALEKYQKGVALVKYCQDKLKQVEEKVKILDNNDDTLKEFKAD